MKQKNTKKQYITNDEAIEEEIKKLLNEIEAEEKMEQAEMQSEITTMNPEEREKRGRTILHLKYKKYNKVYTLSREDEIKTDIKKGDSVLLSITNKNNQQYKCKIIEIGLNYVIVKHEERLPKIYKNDDLKLDYFFNETTTKRWKENLKNLNNNGRKALEYKLKIREIKTSNKNRNISFINESLNNFQKEAIICAVNSNDFFLIHGPFGTGKTTTIVELILQEAKLNHKILVTSESNIAIDNILEKLNKQDGISFIRVGPSDKINKDLIKHTLDYKIKNYFSELPNEKDKIEEEILNNSRIILTTNSSAATPSLRDMEFDIAIIDEASQATTPSILIPINKAEKFILIGDHQQLPPILKNENLKYLKISLFEELINKYEKQSKKLLIQYRMNETLMKFPNRTFYGNKLQCSEESKNNYLNDIVHKKYDAPSALVFIDTSKMENNNESTLDQSNSCINELEAEIVLEIVNMYINKKIKPKDIGVISPYSQQVNLIKKNTNISVKTVDGFQGSEKDIIIVSLVRSNKHRNIGFLKDLNRLNVLLTRAKKKLILVGNIDTLKSNKTWYEFIEFCEKEGEIIKEF